MANNVFTIDSRESREFDAALRAYAEQSKSDFSETMNRKALFISRRALYNTKKADRAKIISELGAIETVGTTRTGRTKRTRTIGGHESLIYKLAAKGTMGLTRAEIVKRAKRILGARLKSISFLASGWIPGIKILNPLVRGKSGLPPMNAKSFGQPKGGGVPAVKSWNPIAVVFNRANSKNDSKGALVKYGMPALQTAVAQETADTLAYLERKASETARKYSAR